MGQGEIKTPGTGETKLRGDKPVTGEMTER